MQGHFQPWTKRAGSFGSAVGRIRSINLTLTLTLTLTRIICIALSVGFMYLLLLTLILRQRPNGLLTQMP